MAGHLDLHEDTRRRVVTSTNAWASTGGGLLTLGLLGTAAVAGAGSWAAGYKWSWPGGLAVAVLAGVAAIVSVLLIGYVVNYPRVLAMQRDEARSRLRDIKHAAESYSLQLGDPYKRTGRDRTYSYYGITVLNTGRGAQFSAVLEELEGAENDSLTNLYLKWGGREDVVAEEIPPGEWRALALIVMRVSSSMNGLPTGLSWTIMTPRGPVGAWSPFSITITMWARISTRGVPEISYSHRFGLRFTPGEVMPTLLPPNPDDERTLRAPSLDTLLDF